MTLTPQEQEAMDCVDGDCPCVAHADGLDWNRAELLSALVRRLLEREKALARIAEAAEYADTMDWRGRRKLANAARALAALSALNPGEKK